jgi:flagellar motor switch protein FliN/FliY
MPSRNVDQILKLEVPLVVRLAERSMSVHEVVKLVPGGIIELPKNADDELDLMVNNKVIGTGTAVKVGENFGIRITYIGDIRQRLAALAAEKPKDEAPSDDDASAMAEAMLAGQI